MSSQAPSLIARLRRPSVAMRWIWVLLVLAKLTFATSCLADALSVPSNSPGAAISLDSDEGSDLNGNTGPLCWHAGLSGCHCSCMHFVAIAPSAFATGRVIAHSQIVPFAPHAMLIAERDDYLRPPIA